MRLRVLRRRWEVVAAAVLCDDPIRRMSVSVPAAAATAGLRRSWAARVR